jgi:two-component system phosphate regulon response regulator PhoB
MLPRKSGLAFARELRSDTRTRLLPIIMVTARTDEADKVAGLEAWVDDYVTKPFSPRELEARIQAVLRRRTPHVSKEAVEVAGLVLNPATRTVNGNETSLAMGPTEFELLHFFMTHTDRVYSRTQILDQVWDGEADLRSNAIDVHVVKLRAKLDRPFGRDSIETVRGVGFRLRALAE